MYLVASYSMFPVIEELILMQLQPFHQIINMATYQSIDSREKESVEGEQIINYY